MPNALKCCLTYIMLNNLKNVEQQIVQGSCLPHLKLTFVIHRGASAAGT